MPRKIIHPDYESTLNQSVLLSEVLPPTHLAHFVVTIIAQSDLSCIYQHYATVGGAVIAPEILLALLFYGYATGVFSSRKIERATYENIAFRFIAGGYHPDHDTIANFRKTFLKEIEELFVQILLIAQMADVFTLENISGDGSKVHADASKSKAVSYQRLGELEVQLKQEVAELFALAERAEWGEAILPVGLAPRDEIALRPERLAKLAEAKTVLQARAQERYETEQAAYEAKLRERDEKAQQSGKKPRGREPQPPTPGPNAKDQYNFTDPDSRIMKNSSNAGFEQHYNVQVAVEQATMLIMATDLSNHPNDKREVEPLLDAILPKLGTPKGAAFDNGFFSEANVGICEGRGIEAYIATGCDPHHPTWQERFAEQPAPPPHDASVKVKMAYKLQTEIGQAVYRLRKCTVEPVIGIIKEVLGFRQFSLRGLTAAAGEWCLVCLAFNLKRLHVLMAAA